LDIRWRPALFQTQLQIFYQFAWLGIKLKPAVTNMKISNLMQVTPVLAVLLGGGCAHETMETRRHEKWLAYSALPQDQRELVDQGHIRAGMSVEAVFIAWGKPAEILESESTAGFTTWRYANTRAEEIRAYRGSRDGQLVLRRHPERSSKSRDATEIVFIKGKVAHWRTLPNPLN
jgi:hypothetical protein